MEFDQLGIGYAAHWPQISSGLGLVFVVMHFAASGRPSDTPTASGEWPILENCLSCGALDIGHQADCEEP